MTNTENPVPALDRLHDHADRLRQQADRIETALRDLTAYDRPDVWRGGRATAFRETFTDWLRVLTAPETGVCCALRDAAGRIDHRAALARDQIDRAQAAVDRFAGAPH